MQKIEWVKGDSVTHAFGHDNEDKFAAASNDEGEMFAVRLEKKVRTFETKTHSSAIRRCFTLPSAFTRADPFTF